MTLFSDSSDDMDLMPHEHSKSSTALGSQTSLEESIPSLKKEAIKKVKINKHKPVPVSKIDWNLKYSFPKKVKLTAGGKVLKGPPLFEYGEDPE